MSALPSLLIAASAVVIFALGALHLWYTFVGNKLHPRDPDLRARLEQVSPVLTRQTTMWRAWVGFNASHSYGALLFGAVYGHLAWAQPAVLRGSPFLLAVGAASLLGYTWLARRYWFSVPFRGTVLATLLYAAGAVSSLT